MLESHDIPVRYQGDQLLVAAKTRQASNHLLLFLHGLGCAKESFDGAFTHHALDGYSICTMDFIGFGGSDKPTDFPYTLEDQAAIAKQVIEYLNPKTVSVVAHSLGGAIGVLLAAQLTNLAGFIDVEGNLVAEDCGLISRNTAKQLPQDFEQKGYPDFLHMLESSDRKDFHEWAKWYKHASPQALHASAQSLVKWSDSGELLQKFNRLPSKTYVYGDEEPKDYLLPQLQDTTIEYIPGLRHFMMAENPQTFFATIARLLTPY